MKKLTGALKGFKAKEFLLNHGEKLGFGLAALLVLVALTKTEWSRYAKAPQDIIKRVDEAKTRIANSVWPAEKQAAYALQDYTGRAQEVVGPLQLAKHEWSTNMWWPLYRKQELAKEPELLAVTDLIATPGRFALGMNPKPVTDTTLAAEGEAEGATAEGAKAKTKTDSEFDPDFAPAQRGGVGLAGAPGGYGPPGAATTGGPGFSDPAGGHGGGGVATTDAASMIPGYGGEYGGGVYGDEGGMMGMTGPAMESRGERFIAVRGVWPLWLQMEKFAKALNLQSTSDARNHLQLLDFVLERQTAVAGTDPWTGPWDTVDVQRALDVLNDAYDFSIDPVDPQITDVVITMPLPARLVGSWGDYATHPRITNFVLPPAELEREMKLQEKLKEEYEKYRLQEQKSRATPKGFSAVQRNFRQMAQDMFQSEYAENIQTEIQNWGSTDMSVRMTLPDIQTRLTAVGRLLLFRYFDFDVRPGYAYRYRVKLVLRNPNFERPLEQVIDASVAEGMERETPYSNITNVAVVPESVNYFLKDVERDPVYDVKSSASRPLARVDFFEWDAAVGTMIRDTIDLTSFGQFIAATKKTLRLDVAAPSLKDTEVAFRSDDLLVDAVGDIKLDTELHKDLKLPTSLRGKAGTPAELLVMDEGGQLRTLDPQANQNKRSELTSYVERERAPFKHLENQEAKPAGMLEGGGYPGGGYDSANFGGEMMSESAGYGGYGAGGPQGKGKSKSKKKNPRKLSGMSPQAGGYPGAVGP